jgi:hypothetical protein
MESIKPKEEDTGYAQLPRLLPAYLLTIKFNFDNQQDVCSALGFFLKIR